MCAARRLLQGQKKEKLSILSLCLSCLKLVPAHSFRLLLVLCLPLPP